MPACTVGCTWQFLREVNEDHGHLQMLERESNREKNLEKIAKEDKVWKPVQTALRPFASTESPESRLNKRLKLIIKSHIQQYLPKNRVLPCRYALARLQRRQKLRRWRRYW